MSSGSMLRDDLARIVTAVPEGARVLDLGCGNGTLLARLRDERGCSVRGIEIDPKLVADVIAKGIPVSCIDLDDGLDMFPDGAFDVVVLSQTLQVVRQPAKLLGEMMRIGAMGIVSYPNFGHWKVRAYLMFRGRMPVSESIPYTWYETPNIHHTTMRDFRDLVAHLGGTILHEDVLREVDSAPDGLVRQVHFLPELRGELVVSRIARVANARASNGPAATEGGSYGRDESDDLEAR